MKRILPHILGLLLIASTHAALITNGGFESGLAGWRPLWSREAKAGSLTLDSQTNHAGKSSARIEHRGDQDWSLEPDVRVPVQPGDLFELEAWLKIQGAGSATLCASTWDDQNNAVAWSFGERTVREQPHWVRVRTRFVVPPGITRIQPRLIGYGAVTAWVDDFTIQKVRNVNSGLPSVAPSLTISNASLAVTWNTASRTLSVLDQRTSRNWSQKETSQHLMVADARATKQEIQLKLLHLNSDLEIQATVKLLPDRPELTLELAAKGELPSALTFPAPFTSSPGQYLVVPMNEGISYPVEDKSIEPMRLVAYGGHGICMAFWGVTDGRQGQMAILETPDDASIRLSRLEGKLVIAPEWDPQKGQFGYTRRLRYIFLDQGGHAAICKRYRAYAKEIGLLKTLAEKRQANPNTDLLIGAVNVWCWDRDAVPLVKEMQSAGIQRLLWSNRQSPANLQALNEMGVLTSRYDIYQDVMNPENFKNLRGLHSDWTTEAWPKDIIITANGSWQKGWGVKGKSNEWYYCGVICDKRAPDYARQRIPPELRQR